MVNESSVDDYIQIDATSLTEVAEHFQKDIIPLLKTEMGAPTEQVIAFSTPSHFSWNVNYQNIVLLIDRNIQDLLPSATISHNIIGLTDPSFIRSFVISEGGFKPFHIEISTDLIEISTTNRLFHTIKVRRKWTNQADLITTEVE